MISLVQLLRESGILLLEIDNKTTLYHRSLHKYAVGDVIDPKTKFGDGSTHWLASQTSEKALEAYRQKNCPEKPSRFNCVYTSLIPNSAFIGKGYLYEVKPVGKFFLTFANYINEINETFERQVERSKGLWSKEFGDMGGFAFPEKKRWEHAYQKQYPKYEDYEKAFNAEKERVLLEHAEYSMKFEFDTYWNPDPSHNIKVYKKWVEVLCEQVRVISTPSDTFKFLRKGDVVKLTTDISADWYRYQSADSEHKLSDEEVAKIGQDFNIVPGDYGREVLTLPKGTVAEVLVAALDHTPLPNEHSGNRPDDYKPYRMLRLQPKGYDFYLEVSWVLRHPQGVQNALEKISANS